MNKLILAAVLAASCLIAAPSQAGGKEALDMMGCTGATIREAFRGDFSRWVLPNFIGGNHLRAGQYLAVEYNANGDRACVVRGAPNGPLS